MDGALEFARLASELMPVGTLVWAKHQRTIHKATVRQYRNNYLEVLVMWDWDCAPEWVNRTWLPVTDISSLFYPMRGS